MNSARYVVIHKKNGQWETMQDRHGRDMRWLTRQCARTWMNVFHPEVKEPWKVVEIDPGFYDWGRNG